MTTQYETAPPAGRAIMLGDQVIGFADSPGVADQIVRALRAYERVHVCTICPKSRDRYRVGRSLGRTIYRMVGQRASKSDDFIGIMDTRDLGEIVAAALNQQYNHQ
jgi:hypothetical protein